MTMKFVPGAILVATLFCGAAHAQDPVEVARARHEHYQQIGKAAKALREELQKPAPDLAVIQASARTLDTLAPQVSS